MKKTHARWIVSILAMIAVTPVTRAQEGLRDHDIVPEDYFSLATVGSCTYSPDGQYIAYTESRWQGPKEKRNTDLWVVRTDNKEIRRLTFDTAGDSSPQWSPDSRYKRFSRQSFVPALRNLPRGLLKGRCCAP